MTSAQATHRVLFFLLLASGCADPGRGPIGMTREITKYPHHASPEWQQRIWAGLSQIREGMTAQQVHAILGEPDEVLPLYEPIVKNAKVIGMTHWYVIRRLASEGSRLDKAEISVRIAFNLDHRVSGVDRLEDDASSEPHRDG